MSDRSRKMIYLIWLFMELNHIVKVSSSTTCASGQLKYDPIPTCLSVSGPNTISQGHQLCGSQNPPGQMLSPHDWDFNEWLIGALQSSYDGEKFWLSLNDSNVEGQFHWADGVSYTDWAPWKSGEPSDDSSKRCVHFKDGEWEAKPCNDENYYFCQYQLIGTEASCLSTSHKLMTSTRICFFEKSTKKTHSQANTVCGTDSSNRGHLATVPNKTVHDFIRSQWSSQDHWIGLNDVATYRLFVWADGSQSTYPRWMSKIASEMDPSDDCYYWDKGDWKKDSCNKADHRIMCQAAPAVDECASNPCQNGATCVDGTNLFTCTCVAGYNGTLCQTDINECASNPCQNGGACTNAVNSYACACPAGFQGVNCQTNIDECASTPCQNGATCVDGTNSFTCTCVAGFDGQLCEKDFDECGSSPCKNGGTCIDQMNSFSCSCATGYAGPTCEIDCKLMKSSIPYQTFHIKKTSGKLAAGHMFELNINFHRCAHVCIKHPDCGSFNYNKNTNACQLNKYCDITLVTSTDFDYWQ